ncbi:alpha/beta hydrolase [Paenibacillus sp. SYP-B4298]|uniref:alpha/beta hydrolase n=1 Tax=Paenibacillus sp. SYP-B4298 TaxID=2996034 RepID=UPI0022DDD0A8|nr:alpha/beta hydrolase-fold protein [Paenibacillus sp. SYP-B4298]
MASRGTESLGGSQSTQTNVVLPNTMQWTMVSKRGRSYRIMAAIPTQECLPPGYPILYVLDGNSVFGTAVEALRLQCRLPEKTGVVPSVIIGIGYEVDEPFSSERFYDLTPEPTREFLYRFAEGAVPEQGGADEFADFLEEELKPLIERNWRIDRTRQSLLGHSLGGLFVAHLLFTRPGSFRYYIAGSPSLHWNKERMLDEERSFVSRLAKGKIAQQLEVLITMGELEASHPSGNYELARKLAERLILLEQHGGRVHFLAFEEEGHVSVLPSFISRALRFACAPE